MADAASNDRLGGAPADGIEEVSHLHVPTGSTMSSTLAQRLANVGLASEGVFTAHEQQQQTDEATALSADASPDR